MSDARRLQLDKDSIPSFPPTQGMHRLRVILKGIHLLKEEGFLGDADDFAANGAGIVCMPLSD